jgi:hypothetical protein
MPYPVVPSCLVPFGLERRSLLVGHQVTAGGRRYDVVLLDFSPYSRAARRIARIALISRREAQCAATITIPAVVQVPPQCTSLLASSASRWPARRASARRFGRTTRGRVQVGGARVVRSPSPQGQSVASQCRRSLERVGVVDLAHAAVSPESRIDRYPPAGSTPRQTTARTFSTNVRRAATSAARANSLSPTPTSCQFVDPPGVSESPSANRCVAQGTSAAHAPPESHQQR